MLIYFILILFIIAGQLLVDGKIIKKKSYCWIIGIILILLCGLRSEELGMWDTASVYIPSFRTINSNSVFDLMQMFDTQYKFIGYVLYSKFIGLISDDPNFYIFMMGWPFYVSLTYLINKYTRKPSYSFLATLAMGYLTYSFSMMRGMIAFAAVCMALDAALENKWKKMIIWTIIGTSFHITSLLFLVVFFVKKITWTIKKIIIVLMALLLSYGVLPTLWQSFVSKFISGILPTYNYYGYIGGVLATGMLLVYAIIILVCLAKIVVGKRRKNSNTNDSFVIKIKRHRSDNKEGIALAHDDNINFLIGLGVISIVILSLTSILSEMIRIAMVFGIALILLAGAGNINVSLKNRNVVVAVEILEAILLIVYFLFSAVPNMYAVPYQFFWN